MMTRPIGAVLAAMVVVCPPVAAQDVPTDSLRPLTVDEAVAVALRNNLPLRIARAQVRVAEADEVSSRAFFDPVLSLDAEHAVTGTDVVRSTPGSVSQGSTTLTAGYGVQLPFSSRVDLSVSGGLATADPLNPSVGPFGDNYSSGVSLSLQQPLLRGFGTTPTAGPSEVAGYAAEASRLRYQRQIHEAVARVEQAYWGLELAEVSERVALESREAARRVHERNVALMERDLVAELDVVTSERALATREAALLDARRTRLDAAEALVFLIYGEQAAAALASEAAAVRTVPVNLPLPPSGALDAATEEAVQQRSDLAAARLDLQGGELSVSVARSELLPALDLTASMSRGGVTPQFRFLSTPDSAALNSTRWSLGARFTLPQGNLRAEAQVERARAGADAARLGLAATENQVRLDANRAVRAVRIGEERLERSRQAEVLAERQYEAAVSSAELGLTSTFDLLLYERDLVEARLLAAQSATQLDLAVTQYRLAVGEAGDDYDLSPALLRGGGR